MEQITIGELLDIVMSNLRPKNDAALSRALEIAPPVVSKLRHGKLPLGPSLQIRIHLLCDFPVRELVDIANNAAAEVRELAAA